MFFAKREINNGLKLFSMNELIFTINEITKFGLESNLSVAERDKSLEKSLIKIYSLYFEIVFQDDKNNYPDYNRLELTDIRQNIESNFSNFGFYKTILAIEDIYNLEDVCAMGDAIEDLSDIISDLLEIKWRIENNGLDDGLWFFQLIFYAHTQQHIINLLNYMKQMSK